MQERTPEPRGRLVLADDGSDSADIAWLWVISHPWPGWQVEVVTAEPAGKGPSEGIAVSDLTHPRTLPDGIDLQIHHKRVAGEPKEVLHALRDRNLMVIGPRGRGLRKALRLGSVSDSLLRDPPMPFVIVRRGVRTRRVMVCADGSPGCRAAVSTLLTMPWLDQTDVSVLTVPEQRLDADLANNECAQAIEGSARTVTARVLTPDPLQVAYHPESMLQEAAEVWGADLIVLGHRGLSRFASLSGGSLATSLATHTPCSVLIAPSP